MHRSHTTFAGWSRLFAGLLAAVTLALGLGISTPLSAQDGAGDDGTTLTLRDGTTIRFRAITVTQSGLQCEETNGNIIHIGWQYLTPRQAYEFRRVALDPNSASIADRLAFANWCMKFDELGPEAVREFEGVMQKDATNLQAERALQRLGYVFRDGKAWKSADWDAEVARRGGNQQPPDNASNPTGNDPANPTTGNGNTAGNSNSGGTAQPAQPRSGPVKVTVNVTHAVDWAAFDKFKCEAKKSFRQNLEEFFAARGFEIVASGADYRVDGEARVKPTNISEFFEIPISSKFQGDVILTITDTKNPGNKRDFSTTSTITRTEVDSALDATLADLAQRIGPSLATFAR